MKLPSEPHTLMNYNERTDRNLDVQLLLHITKGSTLKETLRFPHQLINCNKAQ